MGGADTGRVSSANVLKGERSHPSSPPLPHRALMAMSELESSTSWFLPDPRGSPNPELRVSVELRCGDG